MIDIMEHLQQYVPLETEVDKLTIPGVGEREVHADTFHHVLFGGDQLTAKRARGSQHVQSNSLRGKDRLEGLKASSGRLAHESVSSWCKLYYIRVYMTPS